MRHQAWVQGAIAALLASGHVGQIAAQPSDTASESEQVLVHLQAAPDECAPRAQLEQQVQRRSSRIAFASDAAGVESKQVIVSETDASEPGYVSVQLDFDAGVAPRQRRLTAATCDELVQAIGFVIALTFDPPSGGGMEKQPAEPEQEEVEGDPFLSQPSMSNEPIVDPVDEVPSWAVGSSSGPLPPLDFAFGIGPASLFGPAPNLMFGAEAHLMAAFRGAAALRVDLSWVGGGKVQSEVGRGAFSLMAIGVAACPVALGEGSVDGGRLAVRPCLTGSFGSLRASGSSTERPETHDRPWTALGGSLLVDFRLSTRWQLSANAAWRGALVRDRFQFEPRVIHRVPPWAASASLAAAVVF